MMGASDETYVVVGAGGIGGVVAAGLVDIGRDVHIIDADEAHVRAIGAQGLRVTGLVERLVRVRASMPGDAPASFSRVVLAVKAQHVESALEFIGPRLKADGVILSLPNGLAAVQVAGVVGAGRTLAGQASFGAQLAEPGHVVLGASGGVLLGEYSGGITARSRRIGNDLLAALGSATVTEAAMTVVWSKFVLAVIYIGTALDGRPMADIFRVMLRAETRWRCWRERLSTYRASPASPSGRSVMWTSRLWLIQARPRGSCCDDKPKLRAGAVREVGCTRTSWFVGVRPRCRQCWLRLWLTRDLGPWLTGRFVR